MQNYILNIPYNEVECESYIQVNEYEVDQDWEFHSHDFYEIEYIMSGYGENSINGITYEISPGSLFLISTCDFHKVACKSHTKLRVINLRFAKKFFPTSLKKAFIKTREVPSICINLKEDKEKILFVMQQILEEVRRREAGSEIIIESLLSVILIELFRNIEINKSKLITENDKTYKVIQKAIFYIENHYYESISLKKVAQIAFLTPNYFCECFHNVTGKTYKEYLNDTRISAAAKELVTTTTDISTICYATGFTSLTTFYRNFNKRYGITPNTYRQQILKRFR